MAKIYHKLFALFLALTLLSAKQPDKTLVPGDPLPKGYYVVVAAYFPTQEDFAQRFSGKLNTGGLHTNFGIDNAHKFYYVYLDHYNDFNESIAQMEKVRKDGTFPQAWVYIAKDGMEQHIELLVKKDEPLKKEEPAAVKKEERKVEDVKVLRKEEVVAARKELAKDSKATPVAEAAAVVPEKEEIYTEFVDNPKAEPVLMPQTLKNTQVFFSLYNATTSSVVDGEVEVVDTDRSKLLTKVKGNSYVSLPDPKSKSGQLTLISNAFGYRKEEHQINYLNTEADTLQPDIDLIGNYYMVNFELIRMHKGDIATLYNVYFYNDAAVMLPESKYQLNSLLQMMNDNKKYKIRLHGHTNGNGRGKIIAMGPSHDFFNITTDVQESSGSARELSETRALVIREWLIAQGVSADRIEAKGWGGSRMIHDKSSVHARKNIRVDVEVIAE